MLTSIEQLEKEIEKFHETLTASNELYRLMNSLTDAVSKQTVVFSEQSRSLEKAISRVPDKVKSDYDEMLKHFSSEKNSYLEVLGNFQKAFSESISKLLQDISAIPEDTSKLNSGLIDKVYVKLQDVYSQHYEALELLKGNFSEKITEYCSEITSFQNELKATEANFNEKYATFLFRLETIDINQIYNLCLGIKAQLNASEATIAIMNDMLVSRIETLCDEQARKIRQEVDDNFSRRFLLIYGGLGITIALLLISFIFR